MIQADWIEVFDSGNLISLFGGENLTGMVEAGPAVMVIDLV